MHKKKNLKWVMLCSFILLSALSACGEPDYMFSSALLEGHPEYFMIGTPWVVANMADRFRLRYIPGLPFEMGSDDSEDKFARGDELPQMEVAIPGFWIMGREVTNEEYINCENAGVCTPPETSDSGPLSQYRYPEFLFHPVVGVDWFQSQTYCEWIGGSLPSEPQWEKAGRGYYGELFPWGNDPLDCALLNKKDCMDEDSTMPVESYPGGVSPFGVADMLGNVREWVFDWYTPDGYVKYVRLNPQGPEDGELKVVRGGGFNDFAENLRTTARTGYPPESFHEDVGFRCVVKPKPYASMCNPEYEPLCRDPDIPPRDEPCDPEQEAPSDEGVTISSFGCPENGEVCILFNTGGLGTASFKVTLGGDANWSCNASALGEDLLECCGPEQTMGSKVNVNICQEGGGLILVQDTDSNSGIALASPFKIDPGFNSKSLILFCPDGYALGPGGTCNPINFPNCSDGFTLNAVGVCVPDDEESCPEGSEYNEKTQTCDGAGLCQPGYYYNTKTHCCQPLKGDNYGCPPGSYFDPKYQKCMPIDGNGCPFGMIFDGFFGCMPSPYEPAQLINGNGCPDGTIPMGPNGCAYPAEGFSETIPNPNLTPRLGDSFDGVKDDGEYVGFCPCFPCIAGCGPLPDINPAYEGLLRPLGWDPSEWDPSERDPSEWDPSERPEDFELIMGEGICPNNYYWDEDLKHCRPTNGPGSPCPIGYIYNYKTGCCAPIPGNQGTNCPDGLESENGTAEANGQENGGQTPPSGMDGFNSFFDVFFDITFDVQVGICDPSLDDGAEEEECPEGLVEWNGHCVNPLQLTERNGEQGEEQDGEIGLKLDVEICPREYWNEQTQRCEFPPVECESYEYYDEQLGYCIPLQEDCCPIGWDYSSILGECAPVVMGQPLDAEKGCPEGYEMINRICLLIGRTEFGGGCWNFDVNVPTCIGPCKVGTNYNPTTGRCEKPSDPCASINCSDYKVGSCPANCCKDSATGNTCIPK